LSVSAPVPRLPSRVQVIFLFPFFSPCFFVSYPFALTGGIVFLRGRSDGDGRYGFLLSLSRGDFLQCPSYSLQGRESFMPRSQILDIWAACPRGVGIKYLISRLASTFGLPLSRTPSLSTPVSSLVRATAVTVGDHEA